MAQEPHLFLTIMAAEGLKNVSFMRTKMAPFAVAFVDPYSKHSTRVLAKAGRNPVWNDSIHIPISHYALNDPSAALTVQVFNQGPFTTSIVGATRLPLHDLFRNASLKGSDEGDIITLQLFRPSGRAHGIIRIFLQLSGDGLPGMPRLLLENGDGGNYDSEPVTGIPVIPAMGIHSAVAPMHAESTTEKFAYPYPMQTKPAYMPYPPAPPSRNPRKNNKFLYGLVSGAVAAVLLGTII